MRSLTWVAVAFMSIVLSTGSVRAEAAADPEHPAVHAGEADHGTGKVDVVKAFGLKRYDLGIYTLIVFGALVFILGRYAWGPMMNGLDKREANLRKVHDDAAQARDEAGRSLAEIQARLTKANDEIRAMLDEARRDAHVVKEQMKAEAAVESQAERDRMRREIETARDQALQDIYQQAVQLAAIVSTKAIKRELTPADHDRLIEESLADLRHTVSKA